MFKRANKVTALLVAAASVMSVVPAMAADTTRLGNKEGTVKVGVAYGDGSFAYYGYKGDDDDTGVYVAKSGEDKPKLQDDLEDYRLNVDAKYGDKYVYAKENSNDDEYLIDLSTGKIDEDTTVEEKADNAKSKLVSKLKKAERYEDILKDSDDLASIFDSDYATNPNKFTQVLPGQLGDVWYKYEVTTGGSLSYINEKGISTSSAAKYVGFTTDTGSYVDLSQETNLRVFSTKTERAEWIKEYGDEDKDAGLRVDLVDADVITQDENYLYTLTKVAVTDTNAGGAARLQYFVQKISKSQGSKDDGEAYTAKSIDSYQLQAPNNTIYDEGDFTAAYEKLTGNYYESGTWKTNNELMLGVVAKDGNLFVYTAIENDKVQVWKLKLGKFKKDVPSYLGASAEDVDTNAVKKDGDTDDGDIIEFDKLTSAQYNEDEGLVGLQKVSDYSKYGDIKVAGRDVYRLPSLSIDTKGTVWALEKGKVIKIDGTDKKTVYTVDRAMNAIDAYDENNMIIWDTDGDAYTNISEGKKQTVDDGVAVDPTLGQTTPATVGWKQEATGWTFYDVNGTKVANYWVNDNGTWYYIKADGIMATGWAQVNGTWYYLKANGAMATGWLNDNGTWYYLASSGAMLANTTVDGYKLGASGAWIQ